MTEFDRRLWRGGLVALEKLASDPGENWWKDLLALWRPSGRSSGEHGVRLTVRNGYLNFYRRGQSVARVSGARNGQPVADIHVKYIWEHANEQAYARLAGAEARSKRLPGDVFAYSGLDTLLKWIRAADGWAGEEKKAVDIAVGCNPEVIDLEMGLPACGQRTSALRMDLVALEQAGDAIKIVFWEAKTIDDPRLRALKSPEILKQIGDYRTYMGEDSRRQTVIAAYRRACAVLCDLHDIARSIAPIEDLAPILRRAGSRELEPILDPIPRLVVFDNGRMPRNWAGHEEKLRSELARAGARLLIRRPEACRLFELGAGA